MKATGTYLVSFLTLFAVCAVQTAAAPARRAAALGVMIEAQAPRKCIDNTGSRKPGAGLQGWKCSARNLNQRFALIWQDGGKLWQDGEKRVTAIRNKLSGLCLAPRNGARKPGARIIQAPCGPAGTFPWETVPSKQKGWVRIRARISGLCLTLNKSGGKDTSLVQSACKRTAKNQRFRFRN